MFALLACALALGVSGCQRRTVQAAPPVIGTPQPIENPPPAAQPASNAGSAPETSPPATQPAVNSAPKPAPRRPSPTPKENPEPEPSAPPKPAAPQMSQQLSPADQAVYERKTNEDVAAAEKNLERAYGRELNVPQHDLVDKIRGFLGQAREAIRASDWARARNLAQKAYVLSVELANSL
jgi:hypothetical protein